MTRLDRVGGRDDKIEIAETTFRIRRYKMRAAIDCDTMCTDAGCCGWSTPGKMMNWGESCRDVVQRSVEVSYVSLAPAWIGKLCEVVPSR